MTAFIAGEAQGKQLHGLEGLGDFVAALERPRKVMLMVEAGRGTTEADCSYSRPRGF